VLIVVSERARGSGEEGSKRMKERKA